MFSTHSDRRRREAGPLIVVIGDNAGLGALLCLHLRAQGYGASRASTDSVIDSKEEGQITRSDLVILCDVTERELKAVLARLPIDGDPPRMIGIRRNRIHALSHGDLLSRNVLDKLCELGFACSPRLWNVLLLTAA